VTNDSTLFYATGGLAVARIENNYTLLSSPGNTGLLVASGTNGPGTFGQFGLPGGIAVGSFSTTRVGWVLGGGVETALSRLLGWGPGWTTKVEYLFADLGTVNNTLNTNLVPVCGATCAAPFLVTGSTSFTSSIHVYEQVLRVGLNYKFGEGPLLAKY
jgi:outer membrane immunogenic protein